MAKIPSGILGRVSGKVGDVVGATWKGIPYIRQYVIPANPNTPAQQAERTLFSDLVSFAKTILGGVLQVFWDPFLKSNSGWAHFIGLNRYLYTSPGDWDKVHIAEGTLEGTLITAAAYVSNYVTITWDETVLGNGSLTDKAICVVYDTVNKVAFINSSQTRDDESCGVDVGTGRTVANLEAYLFFADSTTAPTMISYSDWADVA